MELKVWVEGIQRIVCGVTEQTTCQDVVYALAHATGKTGRFTLNERWRSNERLLSPQDHPLKILMKWGKYSHDVQFVLQRSHLDDNKVGVSDNQTKQKSVVTDAMHNHGSSFYQDISKPADKNKDIKKSLSLGGNILSQETVELKTDNIGIVKGIPQKNYDFENKDSRQILKYDDNIYNPSSAKTDNCLTNYQSAQLKREAPPYRNPPGPLNNLNSSHQRVLPPYRDPPPPTLSPSKSISSGTRSTSPSSNSSVISQSSGKIPKPKRNLVKDFQSSHSSSGEMSFQESIMCNTQYRDLVRLVNLQREKLSAQQCELTKVI